MRHLGEAGTEQFTVTTRLNGEVIHTKHIHDPFIHTTVTTKWWWKFWQPITVEVNVSATHSMMSKVMSLDPAESDGVPQSGGIRSADGADCQSTQ
jgi:hypothetical protein